jgi:hypothetical protein
MVQLPWRQYEEVVMPPSLQDVSNQARLLASSDKAILLDELLVQLSEPDPVIHQLWLDEVRRRVMDHRENPEPTFSREEVMADLFEP